MTGAIGTTSSGSVFIGGTVSKINTTALIDAAVAQKTRRADLLQVEIDRNTTRIAAYDELSALTSSLESSLDRLRGPSSLFDDGERVWDLKSGTVTTSNGSDFSSIVDIAIDSEAVAGNYEIEVIRKAQTQKVSSSNVTDKDAALGYTGTFNLGLTGGGSANINVTATTSLSGLATLINAQSSATGVSASILKVSETEFQLVLSGQQTARDIVTSSTGGDDVLNLIGVTDGVGGFSNILQIAQDALIELDGIEIRRDDNNFDDLIDGIDLDINSAAPGTIISLEVGSDVVAAKEAIVDFVEAYNAFRDFVVQNQNVDSSGNVAEDAVLFSDNLLNGLTDQYSNLIGQRFNSGGVIETIRDLGISIGNNNKLQITDEAKLDAALLNNFDDVKLAFASSANTDNTEFRLTGNRSLGGSQSIVFNLTTDGAGTITGVTANGDGAAFTISGNSIVGAAGTQYAGLRFTYVGTDTNVTINANLTQGLADKLINGGNGYTDEVTGLIIQQKAALQEQNTDKTADVLEILTRAETFRTAQIEKYAKFEANLQILEILKSQIRAILGNNEDDN